MEQNQVEEFAIGTYLVFIKDYGMSKIGDVDKIVESEYVLNRAVCYCAKERVTTKDRRYIKWFATKEEAIKLSKILTGEERQPYWDLVDKKAEQNNTIDLDAYAKGVVDGAKWQQTQDKNKFSEEEVLNLLIECSKWQLPQTDEDLAKIKQWFAEFKKII